MRTICSGLRGSMNWPTRTGLSRYIPWHCMDVGMWECTRRSGGRWEWDRAHDGGATGDIPAEGVQGEVIREVAEDILGAADDALKAKIPTRRNGRLRPMTSVSSTNCWIKSETNSRWTRRGFTQWVSQRAAS